MMRYCPNCNNEFAPEDKHCANCGAERPAALQNKKTLVLSQNALAGTSGGANPLRSEPPLTPETPGEIPPNAFLTPIEPKIGPETVPAPDDTETILAKALPTTTPATEDAASDLVDSDKIKPDLPTFWKCAQCVTLNPTNVDYCENCGALKPSAQPTERQAEPGPAIPARDFNAQDVTEARLPIDVIKALVVPEQPKREGLWYIQSSSGTNEGLTRAGGINEDSLFTLELHRFFEGQPETFGFYIVADGMGGQTAGEVASRMAIQTVSPIVTSELAARWATGEKLEKGPVAQVLRDAISLAHTRLREFNLKENIDAGTTMTACCVAHGWAVFANVGDSRTYLFRLPAPTLHEETTDPVLPLVKRNEGAEAEAPPTEPAPVVLPGRDLSGGQTDDLKSERATIKINTIQPAQATVAPRLLIERVTRDQSLVQYLVERGELTLDEVYNDPRRNVILHALGAPDDKVPVDTYQRDLREGDTIMLCSDGLWEMVRDQDIAEELLSSPDLASCVQSLIDQANDNGGADNITVILVKTVKG